MDEGKHPSAVMSDTHHCVGDYRTVNHVRPREVGAVICGGTRPASLDQLTRVVRTWVAHALEVAIAVHLVSGILTVVGFDSNPKAEAPVMAGNCERGGRPVSPAVVRVVVPQ